MTKTLTRYLALAGLMTAPATHAVDFLIGGLESTTLTRIVPDKIVFPYTNGIGALGNWEPYASVMGNSTFLIGVNTFVPGSTTLQRYGVAFQPAAGGANKEGDSFFADDGTPFRDQINASRQDGNPGRVTGDARRGATSFMTGGEASPHVYTNGVHSFGSDNRWNLGFGRLPNRRFGTVQTFSLNPATLAQTMLSKAQDSAYGRDTSGNGDASDQYARFGGDIVCLDNGNFVSVIEDRTRILNPGGNAAVATIFKPDGTVVTERFLIANGDQWSNVAAFLGGFCVRVQGVLYFFDNTGTAIGSGIDQNTAVDDFDGSTLFNDRGRGDDSRIAGHVNSPYVFMAQKRGVDIYLAVWDSRLVASGTPFVGEVNVNELEPSFGGTDTNTLSATSIGRVNLAVDALNRVAVVFHATFLDPNPAYLTQVAMRVIKFNDSAMPKNFTYLTPSFVVFANASTNQNNTARSVTPTVSMTTKQICIAAKGEINMANNPNAAADSPTESNYYTVLSHPNPLEDPTPSVGGSPVQLSIARAGGNVVLSWPTSATGFTLRSTANVTSGTWQTNSPTPVVNGADFNVTEAVGSSPKYYQLIK